MPLTRPRWRFAVSGASGIPVERRSTAIDGPAAGAGAWSTITTAASRAPNAAQSRILATMTPLFVFGTDLTRESTSRCENLF